MATPRKHYFRVADSVLREPWTDSQLATLVRLMAYLNQRWARDGLTSAQACRATLSPQDLMSITRSKRLDSARLRLRYAADNVSITTRYRDEYTDVQWPKYAEFQGLPSEVGAESGQSRGSILPRELPRDFPLRNPQSANTRSESDSEAARASQAARPPEKSAEPETAPDAPSTPFGAWCPPAETREPLAGSSLFAEAKAKAQLSRRLS